MGIEHMIGRDGRPTTTEVIIPSSLEVDSKRIPTVTLTLEEYRDIGGVPVALQFDTPTIPAHHLGGRIDRSRDRAVPGPIENDNIGTHDRKTNNRH